MYLKSIEMIGFKSFVKPTKLNFQPGMACIVGPNGCGKSNVVDAIRWVLGEQSAKTLRGSKQEDFIFNGTELRKPLSMAEVSITFADCEELLDSEYHEMTVTRRVYRSGDGEYFMNRTACRLRDIQRMFMNTGIGTSSYSIMEQGRIDQILSSRPEDRRAVFEEASGITKFKADRKECARKLDQTEANLLRLDDVIREVKRQIGSLQRQAGKARRFKSLRDELRQIDVFQTKQKLSDTDGQISSLKCELTSVTDKVQAAHSEISSLEEQNRKLRTDLATSETEIESMMDEHSSARMRLNTAQNTIQMNSTRIDESRRLSQQEEQAIERAGQHIERQRITVEKLVADLAAAVKQVEQTKEMCGLKVEALTQHDTSSDEIRNSLQQIQAEHLELESTFTTLQNDLIQLDASRRSDVIRRERLAAEKKGLEKRVSEFDEQQSEMETIMSQLSGATEASKGSLDEILKKQAADSARQEQLDARRLQLTSKISSLKAQIEMASDDLLPGNKLVMDKSNPLSIDASSLIGPLAEHITAEPEYQLPLEAALRSWVDAVIVSDGPIACRILESLKSHNQASVRLLAADIGDPMLSTDSGGPGVKLIDHVSYDPALAPLAIRLVGHVRVVDSIAELPSPIPTEAIYISRDGAVARGNGAFEYWDILSIRKNLEDLVAEQESIQQELTAIRDGRSAVDEQLTAARNDVDTNRHKQSLKQGEAELVNRELQQQREKLETVTFELDAIDKADDATNKKTELSSQMDRVSSRRTEIKQQIDKMTIDLRNRDNERASVSAEAMEARIRSTETEQKAAMMENQVNPEKARLKELEEMAEDRSQDMESRGKMIQQLAAEIEKFKAEMSSLEQAVKDGTTKLANARQSRHDMEKKLGQASDTLQQKHVISDEMREKKSDLEVKYAESKMRRQNMIERVASDYSITLEEAMDEHEPEWGDGGRPQSEWIDTRIAELRTKLEGMGSVNLVAIEEHQELEERFEFLNQQRDDLTSSRQKLMQMISQINKTTSEMFQDTFDQVNKNFHGIFTKLFNGGNAKLVMVDEEDIMESGIEIIAKPQGKKLQSVSLLSGGERTLTAVSLLLAIYMVRPSPFCVLDELDAPLDDSNIGRFIKIVQSFLHQSQFLVITHNQQTISAGDVLYGVTMEEKGVSKLVSMKFPEHAEARVEKAFKGSEEETEDEAPESAEKADAS